MPQWPLIQAASSLVFACHLHLLKPRAGTAFPAGASQAPGHLLLRTCGLEDSPLYLDAAERAVPFNLLARRPPKFKITFKSSSLSEYENLHVYQSILHAMKKQFVSIVRRRGVTHLPKVLSFSVKKIHENVLTCLERRRSSHLEHQEKRNHTFSHTFIIL